jgi:hypothetical protein
MHFHEVFMTTLFSAHNSQNKLFKHQNSISITITQWLILAIVVGVTLFNVRESMLRNIAFDAIPYLDGYVIKFTTEGRWINFALFEFLRTIPQVVAVTLNTVFIFIFGYQVAKEMKQETWFAIFIALIMVNVPQFTMLFKWPMTLLPSTMALAILACLKDRYSRTTLLIAAGIFLCATYPAFYFIFPLLFIRRVSEQSYGELVKFLLLWILGYAIGYAVAQASVYTYTSLWTDHTQFIELARWRTPNPITDLHSLSANVAKSVKNIVLNVQFLSELSPLLLLPIIIATLWALVRHTKYTVIVMAVIFSLYASVVPVGVNVPLRSGITIPVGMLAIALLVRPPMGRAILLMSLFIPFAYQMHSYNLGYNGERIMIANMLEANDPNGYLKQSDRFKEVVITMDDETISRHFYELTNWPQLKHNGYLRTHYIKAYLYEFGWHNANIKTNPVINESVKGEATVDIDHDTIYLTVE